MRDLEQSKGHNLFFYRIKSELACCFRNVNLASLNMRWDLGEIRSQFEGHCKRLSYPRLQSLPIRVTQISEVQITELQ
jgi:hypothetical protein